MGRSKQGHVIKLLRWRYTTLLCSYRSLSRPIRADQFLQYRLCKITERNWSVKLYVIIKSCSDWTLCQVPWGRLELDPDSHKHVGRQWSSSLQAVLQASSVDLAAQSSDGISSTSLLSHCTYRRSIHWPNLQRTTALVLAIAMTGFNLSHFAHSTNSQHDIPSCKSCQISIDSSNRFLPCKETSFSLSFMLYTWNRFHVSSCINSDGWAVY